MAGGAVTDLDDVLALGFKGKVLIESGNGIGFGLGDADLPGDVGEQFAGQLTVFRLNVLHDGNQCAVFLAITRDDLIGFAVVRLIKHRL